MVKHIALKQSDLISCEAYEMGEANNLVTKKPMKQWNFRESWFDCHRIRGFYCFSFSIHATALEGSKNFMKSI